MFLKRVTVIWSGLLLLLVVPSNAQSRNITVSGVVRDAGSGEPIVAASVILDSFVVAATNEEGSYETADLSVEGRILTLLFRRIGYAPSSQDVAIPETDASLEVNVTLFPAPANVERIVVRGERVAIANPGLVGFYERREQGFGRYLTGEEIDRIGGADLTNHLRRLRIRAVPLDQRDPFARPEFPKCMVAFVDGVRLMDLATINEWVPASSLGGIEYHRIDEIGYLPGTFLPPPPPGCDIVAGIVMFWSKVLRESSPFELGLHLGATHGGPASGTGEYVGASFRTRVRRGNSLVRLQLSVNVRAAGEGDRWQALANLMTRPFGRRTPLYCGIGAGVSKRDTRPGIQSGESLAAHHGVLAGIGFDIAGTRPFVEAQLLDPLKPSRTSIGVLLGIRVLLGH